MDLIGELKAFERTAHTNSLSRTARELRLSVASVSKRLEHLERRLGVRLFNRSTRGLALTDEGHEALATACRLLADADALQGMFADAPAAIGGTLRVAAPSRFGETYVTPAVAAFLRQHPHAWVDLQFTDRTQNLIDEGIDLAIRIGPLADSGYIVRKLSDSQRVVCASPAYLERRGRPVEPRDLEDHDCLVLEGNDTWRFERDGEAIAVRVQPRVRCRQSDAVSALARLGTGIALKSIWDVADDLEQGRLETVLPVYTVHSEAAISLLLPHRRFVPPRVRAFIECLEAAIGDPPAWVRP